MTDEKEPTMNERLSAYVDDALAPGDRAALEKALAESPDLRRELSRLRALRSLLRSMPTPAPTLDFYRKVRRAAEPRRWRFVLPPLAAAAAAALVMVAVHRDVRRTVGVDALRPLEKSRLVRVQLSTENSPEKDRASNALQSAPAGSGGDYEVAAAPANSARPGPISVDSADRKADVADDLSKERLEEGFAREASSHRAALASSPAAETEGLPAAPRSDVQTRGFFKEKDRRVDPEPSPPGAARLKAGAVGSVQDKGFRAVPSGGFALGASGAGAKSVEEKKAQFPAAKREALPTGAFSNDGSALSDRQRTAGLSGGGPIAGFRIPAKTAVPLEWRGDDSGVLQFRTVVVRDAAAWKTLWAEHAALRVPPPPPPAVDFSREMIVGVFLGQKPSGGFEAGLADTREEKGGLTVSYREVTPDPDQSQITVLTAPYHLRVVPRTAGAVRFKKIP
ncbi:MAG: protease complex subunit PrcB family protein [Elusimicrobia bacterium]|nr:protease complex subunit PrcB family protein [Elusimicrobiota bacterium]